MSRHEPLRTWTQFASRRDVEHFVKDMQDLRNNLAHSQDILGDWETIVNLAKNVRRVVLGPGNAPPAEGA